MNEVKGYEYTNKLNLMEIDTPSEAFEMIEKLAERSETDEVFNRVAECIDVVSDNSKDSQVREAIISGALEYFYPVLEEIEEKKQFTKQVSFSEIHNLGAKLQKTIEDCASRDDFVRKCSHAFLRIYNLRRKHFY